MALTRPRALQLFDIDYKQAVRVLTDTDINLSGGAPDTVDGISLAVQDRVLVSGQSDASENGLYIVTTLGSGSNGTWVRSTDANQTGSIQAGTTVMVTEGDVYGDTQWKLITNNPIVLNTTDLVWEQNSAFAFGNIYANGTAVLANIVGDTLNITNGNNIVITANDGTTSIEFAVADAPVFVGNVQADYFIGNGRFLSGIDTTLISNGTTEVRTYENGNVAFTVAGASNIVLITSDGITATGNIVGGNLTTAGNVTATELTVTGNAIVGNVTADAGIFSGSLVSSANITAEGTLTATGNSSAGNISTPGQIEATGNITTSGFYQGNGAALAGINVFSTITIEGQDNIVADSISDTLTLFAGTGIVLQTDAANDVVTISTVSAGGGVLNTGGDMGTVVEVVDTEEDLGTVDPLDAVTSSTDMETIVTAGVIYPDQLVLPSYTVSELGSVSATPAGQMVFCTNDAGGAIPAFSDGTDWRRVSDRSVVS